jgi:hypothetical protein
MMNCKGLALYEEFVESFDAILMEIRSYDRANSSMASLRTGCEVGGLRGFVYVTPEG